jgi:hypothetical protein
MKFLRKLFEKYMVTEKNDKKSEYPLTETMIAEMIKDPMVVSSKMVRKIVLNGLIRLEMEGEDPFDEASKANTKR